MKHFERNASNIGESKWKRVNMNMFEIIALKHSLLGSHNEYWIPFSMHFVRSICAHTNVYNSICAQFLSVCLLVSFMWLSCSFINGIKHGPAYLPVPNKNNFRTGKFHKYFYRVIKIFSNSIFVKLLTFCVTRSFVLLSMYNIALFTL